MQWNWQQKDWPHFNWSVPQLEARERVFLRQAGIVIGVGYHLTEEDEQRVLIDLMSGEGVDTADIEGEHLDRESLQSSIRRQLGLSSDQRSSVSEAGMAEMMVNLYQNIVRPLSHQVLFDWHAMIMNGRRDVRVIGDYRMHDEPMEIVSGPIGPRRRVHYVAPGSQAVLDEMERLLAWLGRTGPDGADFMPSITRAGIAHLWFESIHPFEDGNGRVGRALSEFLLAQGVGHPVITGLSGVMARNQKAYYDALASANRSMDASTWLDWFSEAVLEAQQISLSRVSLAVQKGHMLRELRDILNPRQEKMLLKLFEAEAGRGFAGGLSASNYRAITGAPTATATRDLAGLVEAGALIKTGALKSTRYHLNVQFPKLCRKATKTCLGGPK